MSRAFVLLAAVAVALPGRADERKADPKPDADLVKLQGKWRIVSHTTAGADDTQECVWEMEVKGDRYTLKADGTTCTGTIKLDSLKTPKELEYTAEDEEGETVTCVGVYEIDGDTYRTCDVEKGKDERPTDFKTKAKTGQVAVWKRVKVPVRD